MPKPLALDIYSELTSLDQSQFAIYIRDIQSNQVQQVYHTTTNLTNKET